MSYDKTNSTAEELRDLVNWVRSLEVRMGQQMRPHGALSESK